MPGVELVVGAFQPIAPLSSARSDISPDKYAPPLACNLVVSLASGHTYEIGLWRQGGVGGEGGQLM